MEDLDSTDNDETDENELSKSKKKDNVPFSKVEAVPTEYQILALALRLSKEHSARQNVENTGGNTSIPANMADQIPNKSNLEKKEKKLIINGGKKKSQMVPSESGSKKNPVRKSKHFCGECDGCKRQDCKKCSSCQDNTLQKKEVYA